jgi:hypothetical protein
MERYLIQISFDSVEWHLEKNFVFEKIIGYLGYFFVLLTFTRIRNSKLFCTFSVLSNVLRLKAIGWY